MVKVVKHLNVFGRVQGVGFRYSVYDEARRQGVTGWVKNKTDGSVEAIVQADNDSLLKFIQWIKKSPGASHVERLEESEGKGNFTDFQIH